MKNLKLATGALDLALGRGGDQAVIKTKISLLSTGVKSKAVEKTTSKIKTYRACFKRSYFRK